MNYMLVRRDFVHPSQLEDAISSPLSIKACHGFCGKASAMYATADFSDLQEFMINYLFPEWFSLVTINGTRGRSYSQFFTKFIASYYRRSPKDA